MAKRITDEQKKLITELTQKGQNRRQIAKALGISEWAALFWSNPDKWRSYSAQYSLKHKTELDAYRKSYYEENAVSLGQKNKEYAQQHKEERKQYSQVYWSLPNNKEKRRENRCKNKMHINCLKKIGRQNQRLLVLKHYSRDKPKCAICGEEHLEFLCVDHIPGGGRQHYKKIGGPAKFISWLIRNNFPEGYQILCYCCNWDKRTETSKNYKNSAYKKYIEKLKLQVLETYSKLGVPMCECCGETRVNRLVMDHIHGNGNKHRKELRQNGNSNIYLWLKKSGYPSGYRILCQNCNCSLGHYGYCPHKKESMVIV